MTDNKQLLSTVADAIATADTTDATYEDLAAVAILTFNAWRMKTNSSGWEELRDYAPRNNDQEDDGA